MLQTTALRLQQEMEESSTERKVAQEKRTREEQRLKNEADTLVAQQRAVVQLEQQVAVKQKQLQVAQAALRQHGEEMEHKEQSLHLQEERLVQREAVLSQQQRGKETERDVLHTQEQKEAAVVQQEWVSKHKQLALQLAQVVENHQRELADKDQTLSDMQTTCDTLQQTIATLRIQQELQVRTQMVEDMVEGSSGSSGSSGSNSSSGSSNGTNGGHGGQEEGGSVVATFRSSSRSPSRSPRRQPRSPSRALQQQHEEGDTTTLSSPSPLVLPRSSSSSSEKKKNVGTPSQHELYQQQLATCQKESVLNQELKQLLEQQQQKQTQQQREIDQAQRQVHADKEMLAQYNLSQATLATLAAHCSDKQQECNTLLLQVQQHEASSQRALQTHTALTKDIEELALEQQTLNTALQKAEQGLQGLQARQKAVVSEEAALHGARLAVKEREATVLLQEQQCHHQVEDCNRKALAMAEEQKQMAERDQARQEEMQQQQQDLAVKMKVR